MSLLEHDHDPQLCAEMMYQTFYAARDRRDDVVTALLRRQMPGPVAAVHWLGVVSYTAARGMMVVPLPLEVDVRATEQEVADSWRLLRIEAQEGGDILAEPFIRAIIGKGGIHVRGVADVLIAIMVRLIQLGAYNDDPATPFYGGQDVRS